MINIPKNLQDLLTDEKKAFVYLATTMPDGTPQVTPVWFNTDGEYVLGDPGRGRGPRDPGARRSDAGVHKSVVRPRSVITPARDRQLAAHPAVGRAARMRR